MMSIEVPAADTMVSDFGEVDEVKAWLTPTLAWATWSTTMSNEPGAAEVPAAAVTLLDDVDVVKRARAVGDFAVAARAARRRPECSAPAAP
ncbi:hypothetical protein GCM10025867_12430 [Frondihabitans sucicola]|uniref:Uncharacterized protein n=1 Tax=Frondihabitans sucicola TaxID=1268041 RepID=A0ABM8GKT1_9MICO|nr:hypothetical protein [Frondihabitans sucicola]BDZ49002.1 hypothetical protein GCM10025867_12430 [Frondihabitans sucicola]